MSLEIRAKLQIEEHSDCHIIGRLGFLAKSFPIHGRPFFIFSSEPFRTNMGGIPILHGWLGSTDNVSSFANGFGIVCDVLNDPSDGVIWEIKVRKIPKKKKESALEFFKLSELDNGRLISIQ